MNFAIALSDWGIGRFPLDLIIFLSIAFPVAFVAGLNRNKFFAEGNAFTKRKF